MSERSSATEMLQKVFMLGVGAASLTREKVQELVDELVRRGQLSAEQGQNLVEEATDRARVQTLEAKETLAEAWQDGLRNVGIAMQDQVDEMERRISVLEAKVYGQPSRIEETETGFVVTPTEEEEPT